jgi:ribosomal protein S18 acetylase RimI-like enzyme
VLLRRAPRSNDVDLALERFTAAFGADAPMSLAVDDPDGTRADLAPLVAQGLVAEAPLVLVATEVARPVVGDVQVRTIQDGGSGPGVRFEALVAGRLAGTAGVSAAGSGLARLLAPHTSGADRVAGIAQLLVVAAFDHAVRHEGAHALVIVADEGHHAVPLYRSIGFRVAERQLRAFRA